MKTLAPRPLWIRYTIGHRGSIFLFLLVFVYVVFSANLVGDSTDVKLSINFKTLRKLQYQSLISKNSPGEYESVDDSTALAELPGKSGRVLIKALPIKDGAEDPQNIDYRIQFNDGSPPIFIFADTKMSRELDGINQTLNEAGLIKFQSAWRTLSINGQVTGSYLTIHWPKSDLPLIYGWSNFENEVLPTLNKVESDKWGPIVREKISSAKLAEYLVVGEKSILGQFVFSFIQPSYLKELHE